MNSVVTGAALGSGGGPIGLAIGAGLGYLHGLWAKKKADEQARAAVARQKQKDEELEREIAAQRAGSGAGRASSDPEQGVTAVKDDPGGAGQPAADAGTAGPDGVDRDGFRAVHEGRRIVRRERDADGDGKPDVIIHYDAAGQVERREESGRLDGRIDTWTFYVEDRLQRKESDTDADGKPDVWAFYDRSGNLARMESLVDGGRRLTQFYDEGRIVRAEELGQDGDVSAVSHYEGGKLVRRELYELDERLFARVPVLSEPSATVER
jgi:hypothetical protein